MAQIVDPYKDAYGLNGGTVISGSQTVAVDGYVFYPLIDTTAEVNFPSLTSGSFSATFVAGIPVYGNITEVTQSSGLSIVYNGRGQYQ